MSYHERTGDLFAADDLDAIAHGVNCMGYMGKGIALEFARRYPRMKEWYVQLCEDRHLLPGDMRPWREGDGRPDAINLATQYRPGPDAKLRWVAQAVGAMLGYAETQPIERIGMPRIGCGIGGLEWVEVRMILELLGNESSVELVVFSL